MAIVTAQEAAVAVQAHQRQMNGSRILPPTLARIQRMQAEETFHICNVGPWDHQLSRASLMIYVPGYDPKQDTEKLGYAKSQPLPDIRREPKIVDEAEFSWFEDDGRAVARDLCFMGAGHRAENNLGQYGVFIPMGSLPAKEEIATAQKNLGYYIDRLIMEARDAYDKGPDERKAVISERHLWAATRRGINEQWTHHQHTQESAQCEMCGKFNPAAIAKCQCGHIVNFELHERLMNKQAEYLNGLGKGK